MNKFDYIVADSTYKLSNDLNKKEEIFNNYGHTLDVINIFKTYDGQYCAFYKKVKEE